MSLDLPLDRIAALCREYGVIELDVFGSVALVPKLYLNRVIRDRVLAEA